MATLATILNRVMAKDLETADTRKASDLYKVRAFANEDVFFYVKRIDNARVVREADPRSGACWRFIGLACAAVMMLVGGLLPSVYGMLAGYQIQSLREDRQRLVVERSALDLEQATLLSSKRLNELAHTQEFVPPAPGRLVYLDNKDRPLAAMNSRQTNQQ